MFSASFSQRFFIVIFMALATAAQAAKPAAPEVAYKGAIVIDAADGKVLFEQNADVVTPPASMTKLMTFAVVHDLMTRSQITLQTPITATAEDTRMGGTQVWLKEHETFPVEELLYAIMIQSANDAAHALARAAAGSLGAFVDLMNAKAHELGMTGTTFRTPHGLPPSNRKITDGDLTSPRDFAVLSRWLVQNTNILKYTSLRQRAFGAPERSKLVEMVNHNKLIGRVAGVDGLKTGFTSSAGFCLAATQEKNGRRLIAVVMGSPASKTRDLAVTDLLARAFVNGSISGSGATVATPTAPAINAAPAANLTLKPALTSAANPISASSGPARGHLATPRRPAASDDSPVSPATSPVSPAPATGGTAEKSEPADDEPIVKFTPAPAKAKR